MSSVVTQENPYVTPEGLPPGGPGRTHSTAGRPLAPGTGGGSGSSPVIIAGRSFHQRQLVAGAFVVAGFIAIFIGWFGTSGTRDVWQEIPYLVSGGILGAALVAIGVVVYLSYEHMADREYVEHLIERLEGLELGLAGEFDALSERLDAVGRRTGASSRARQASQ